MGIHPAIRKVWRFSAVMSALVIIAVASAVEFAFLKIADGWPIRFPLLGPLFGIAVGAYSLALVNRQWENWKYEVTTDTVTLSWGVFWKTRRTVPRQRIQHVDINSGPLDRRFGLVQMSLYVAGSMGSVGAIPGLRPEEAEALRTALLTKPEEPEPVADA
jgi:membrane protein YdbS with pleckstrin-like domain